MNWSRGLFRIWIAFTVVWVLCVVGGAYNGWPQKQEWTQTSGASNPRSEQRPVRLTYVGPDVGSARKHIVQAADGAKYSIEAPEGATTEQIIAFAQKNIPTTNATQSISKPANVFDRYDTPQSGPRENYKSPTEIDTKYREAVLIHLAQASMAAISVPGILFLLGWTLLWISRGFKKT